MRRPTSHRRSGSTFLLVLGVSMLVTIIGLSSLLVGRLRLRVAALNERTIQADGAASSMVELALLRIANDRFWRTTYTHDTWTAGETIDDITYSFKLVDEQDGDLTTGTADSVRLLGKATVGGVVRMYSVLLSGGETVLDRRVAADDDDAEQRSGDGYVYLDSSDLELVVDSDFGNTDITGMRFTNVIVPQGAAITNAYVQFQVDETTSGACSLVIVGEDTDDASQFSASPANLTLRPTTFASVAWSPPAWGIVAEAGTDQRTPDISTVIKDIVDRAGWSEGSAIAIIMTGTGTRTAESHDGNPGRAPVLHVEWIGSSSVVPVPGTFQREVFP